MGTGNDHPHSVWQHICETFGTSRNRQPAHRVLDMDILKSLIEQGGDAIVFTAAQPKRFIGKLRYSDFKRRKDEFLNWVPQAAASHAHLIEEHFDKDKRERLQNLIMENGYKTYSRLKGSNVAKEVVIVSVIATAIFALVSANKRSALKNPKGRASVKYTQRNKKK